MKKQEIMNWCAVGIIVLSLLSIGFSKVKQIQYNQQLSTVKAELKKQNTLLSHTKRNVKKQKLDEALVSSNNAESQNTLDYDAKKELSHSANKFFDVLLTYDDQKSWLSRKNKAKKYATSDVLKNKKFFNDGLDSTGHSIIEAKGLNSTFISSQTYLTGVNDQQITDGIAKVVYLSRLNDSDSSGETTDYYQLKYDLNQNKLIQVERLGTAGTTNNK